MTKPYFLLCNELITYNDYNPNNNKPYKQIAKMECKAFNEQRPCNNRGKCILAREADTWKVVSSKSWSESNKN